MKCIITGSAGFIGHAVAIDLLAKGHIVIGIDDLEGCALDSPPVRTKSGRVRVQESKGATFVQGNIRMDKTWDHADLNDVDVIFHLAASAGLQRSIVEPDAYHKNNTKGTEKLLARVTDAKIPKLVFASSSSVFGHQNGPTSETVEYAPTNPYAQSKVDCERMMYTARFFHPQTKIIVLRLFNVYGPGQRQDLVFSKWANAMAHGDQIIVNDAGNPMRDFTYIRDIVRAFELAAFYDADLEFFNIGSGSPKTLKYALERMRRYFLFDKEKIHYGESLREEALITHCDRSKAEKQLNWIPSWSFEDGIDVFCQWYRNFNQP